MTDKQKRLNMLRLNGVKDKVQLSKPSIYRQIATGDFPKPRKIGVRAVAWVEDEIDEWIDSREVA